MRVVIVPAAAKFKEFVNNSKRFGDRITDGHQRQVCHPTRSQNCFSEYSTSVILFAKAFFYLLIKLGDFTS